ncbi:hypothetical protein ACED98_08025 [Streptococcus thoraltensis]
MNANAALTIIICTIVIIIPITKDGGFHVIPKIYHKDLDLVEEEE